MLAHILYSASVSSSWCRAAHFVLYAGNRLGLAITFNDNYTALYDGTGDYSFFASFIAAPSKGKYVHAELYDIPYFECTLIDDLNEQQIVNALKGLGLTNEELSPSKQQRYQDARDRADLKGTLNKIKTNRRQI